MFTGLVETMGIVRELRSDGTGRLLTIEEANLAPQLVLGESVANNGVCLTVVDLAPTSFSFQVGPETLRCTNLGELAAGSQVNLERSLSVNARLGGHLVQGHVDGTGSIARRDRQGDWEMVFFSCGPELTKYMVPKGSITVDGVSLTLVDVAKDGFSVALIPHTMHVTTLGFKKAGDSVNLETDLIAKYLRKFLDAIDPADFFRK